MLLLIYQDREDPVVKTVTANHERLDRELVALSMQEILNDAKIFDVIEDGSPRINWQFHKYGSITNSPDVKLLNRVSAVPDFLFDDFHSEDRDYARTEFNAYMTFALNAFPVKLNTPSFFGLAGNQYPLPMQWSKVRKLNLSIDVPHYYLGSRKHCPFEEQRKDIVYSSTYAFRHWRPGPVPQAVSVFAFRRPKGEPIFTFATHQNVIVMPGSGASMPDETVVLRLRDISVTISKAFDCSIAELLFFVDGSDITFGVLDIRPVVTDKSPEFSSTLIRGLQSYFGAA